AVRDAIPADRNGRVLDPPEMEAERIKEKERLKDWDAPDRQGYLYAEHADYHDFETCMLDNGWERVKYVPYGVAKLSKEQYLESHINYKRPDAYYERNQTRDRDFQNLND